MEQKLFFKQNKRLPGLTLFFVYLILISFVLGQYFFTVRILGIQWYAYRVLVIFLLFFGIDSKLNSKIEKSFIVFGITLFVYGMISLLWSSNFVGGFKYSTNIAFGILLTYVLLGLINTRRMAYNEIFEHFARAWMFAVFISAIFLVQEHLTGQTGEFSRARMTFGIESSTGLYTASFAGPSGYGPFLVIGLPLFFYMVFASRNIWEKLIFFIGIFFSTGAIILTGSRISAFAMVLTFLIVIIVNIKHKAITLLILVLSAVVSIIVSYQINPKVFEKHFKVTPESISDINKQSSLKARVTEIRNGIAVLIDTNGLGCGPGNYVKYKIEHIEVLPYPEQSQMSSHSVILSIVAEYGLIVFVAFFFWFFYVFFHLVKISRTLVKMKRIGESVMAKTLLITQLMFFVWSFAFGGGLEFSLIWLYFATLTLLASSLSIFVEKLKSEYVFYSKNIIEQQKV